MTAPDVCIDLKEPSEYYGELLCARCGTGEETGSRYKICTDEGVTHEESCARYNYGDLHVCDRCEKLLRDEVANG